MTNNLNWKDLQKDLDEREKELVNFVLSLVEKEVGSKYEEMWKKHEDHDYQECCFETVDISTIINNLRV